MCLSTICFLAVSAVSLSLISQVSVSGISLRYLTPFRRNCPLGMANLRANAELQTQSQTNSADFMGNGADMPQSLSSTPMRPRSSRSAKAADATQDCYRRFKRRFANTPCCACCCPCCDKDDGTPSCLPFCKPICARFTDSVHDQLSAVYDEWAGASAWHEAGLLAIGTSIIALLQVIFVETVPSSVRLENAPPLRRYLAGVFFFNDMMFFLLVLAIWRHLVPNVHTRRAVRFSSHL